MVELNANGSVVTVQMAKQIRFNMLRAGLDVDAVQFHPEQKPQILNIYEACDVTTHTVTDEINMRSLPHTFAGMPVQIDAAIPAGEIWFSQKGKIVGKITGLAKTGE